MTTPLPERGRLARLPQDRGRAANAPNYKPCRTCRSYRLRRNRTDERMSGCPVVPMNDDPMKSWERGHPACGGPGEVGPSPGDAGILPAAARAKSGPPLGTRASCPRRTRGSASLPPHEGAASRRAPPRRLPHGAPPLAPRAAALAALGKTRPCLAREAEAEEVAAVVGEAPAAVVRLAAARGVAPAAAA